MEKGEITTSFRLTIPERKRQAKMLVASGMSNREAAEALGVDEKTVRRDLGADNCRNNADNCRTPPANPNPDPPASSEGDLDDDVPDQMTVRERFLRAMIADNLIGLDQLPKKYRAILFDRQIEKYGAEIKGRLAIREENHGNDA
jgi:DNA-directed RNA polymerase specialized sigma24 family protein